MTANERRRKTAAEFGKPNMFEQMMGFLAAITVFAMWFPIYGIIAVVTSILLIYRARKYNLANNFRIAYWLLLVIILIIQVPATYEYLKPPAIEFTPNNQASFVDYIQVEIIENSEDVDTIKCVWSKSRAPYNMVYEIYKDRVIESKGYIDSTGLARGAYYLVCEVIMEDGDIEYAESGLMYISGKRK